MRDSQAGTATEFSIDREYAKDSITARNDCLDGTLNDNMTPSSAVAATLDGDAELAVRIRAGDPCAWEQLYDRHSADIWRYVSRLSGNIPETVAEIVQEVFLAAARGIRTYDPERGTYWRWLSGIAHRQVADHFRKQQRIQKGIQIAANHHAAFLEHAASCATNPVELLEQRELAEVVRSVIRTLPEEYAALLTAKYMDMKSVEEIRIQFGGSSDSIRSKLRRARAEFRNAFERTNEGGKP